MGLFCLESARLLILLEHLDIHLGYIITGMHCLAVTLVCQL